jgi:AcrR family transcriptional regulator
VQSLIGAKGTISVATPRQAPKPTLQLERWIAAGFLRLGAEGLDAVRVEVLARDLGVSKGSFYWHFQDREDLLAKLLSRWESNETEWLRESATDREAAATRWARFVRRCTDPERTPIEAAIRAWARHDSRVARIVSAVEKEMASFIAAVLREIGFTHRTAEAWSALALLVYLGWLDRATRDGEFARNDRSLGEFLSELILAASARSSSFDPGSKFE